MSVRIRFVAILLALGVTTAPSRAGTGAEVLSKKYNAAKQNLAAETKARDKAMATYNKALPEIQKLQEEITQTRLSMQQAQIADSKQAKAEQQAIESDPKLIDARKKLQDAEANHKQVEARTVDTLLHSATYETADTSKRQEMRTAALEAGECLKARQKMQEAGRKFDDMRDKVTKAHHAANPVANSQKEWRTRLAELEKKIADKRREADRHKAEYVVRAASADKYSAEIRRIENVATASKMKLEGMGDAAIDKKPATPQAKK